MWSFDHYARRAYPSKPQKQTTGKFPKNEKAQGGGGKGHPHRLAAMGRSSFFWSILQRTSTRFFRLKIFRERKPQGSKPGAKIFLVENPQGETGALPAGAADRDATETALLTYLITWLVDYLFNYINYA